jgi:1-acyl-sn-glycerol-3-phosphate acyltransferase
VLRELGIPKIWGDDPERLWPFLKSFVPPSVLALAPGSYGYGAERVPREGGLVIALNHLSALDPPLAGSFSPRAVYYMTKTELLDGIPAPVGELLRYTGAFSVRRGQGDREALRVARELVREGRAVGIFVEGTRQRFGHPGAPHPGAAMIAMQEDVLVVPCGLDSFGWSFGKPRPCCVVWGEPLDLSGFPRNGRGYRAGAAEMAGELLRLWRQACEAVAAGFPPTLPDGARRHGPIWPWRHASIRSAPARPEGDGDGAASRDRAARARAARAARDR